MRNSAQVRPGQFTSETISGHVESGLAVLTKYLINAGQIEPSKSNVGSGLVGSTWVK